jgi:hypothetical protein
MNPLRLVRVVAECQTQEGKEVGVFVGEEEAMAYTEFLTIYINPSMVDSIAPAYDRSKSVIYMRSGDSFVMSGSPDEVYSELGKLYQDL